MIKPIAAIARVCTFLPPTINILVTYLPRANNRQQLFWSIITCLAFIVTNQMFFYFFKCDPVTNQTFRLCERSRRLKILGEWCGVNWNCPLPSPRSRGAACNAFAETFRWVVAISRAAEVKQPLHAWRQSDSVSRLLLDSPQCDCALVFQLFHIYAVRSAEILPSVCVCVCAVGRVHLHAICCHHPSSEEWPWMTIWWSEWRPFGVTTPSLLPPLTPLALQC